MDGREYMNMPPLGLPLEAVRVSSGAADHLVPSTGQIPPFYTAKYFPAHVGLPTQPGFPSLGRSLYHSYNPLSHLEPSKAGSPSLTHMGQHDFIEPQKDGFCFSGQSSAYLRQPSIRKTSTSQAQSSHLKENESAGNSYRNSEAFKESKEKLCRNELSWNSQCLGTSKRDGWISEERLCDMADNELEIKVEKEKKKCGLPKVPKIGDHASTLSSDHVPIHWLGNNEIKSTRALQTAWLSSCNHGSDSFAKVPCSQDVKTVKNSGKHEETVRSLCPSRANQTNYSDSAVSPATTLNVLCSCSSLHHSSVLCKIDSSSLVPPQAVHTSMYNIQPKSKDSYELKTSTCEVSDEHHDPIHFGHQSIKGKEASKLADSSEDHYSNVLQEVANNEFKGVEVFKQKESVICCNPSLKCQGVSDFLMDISGINYLDKGKPGSTKAVDTTYYRQVDPTKGKFRDCNNRNLQQHNIVHSPANLSEQNMKHIESGNVSSAIFGSSIQHFQHNHGKEESKKLCTETQTLSTNKAISEFTYPSIHSESCAMQNLMNYSGIFEKDKSCKSDKRSPFGGLGHLKLDESHAKASNIQSLSHQEIKRETDKSERTTSCTKDTVGFQGEVEVRNPPVGIAVAVARQKNNNGSKSIFSKGHTSGENRNEQMRQCNERITGLEWTANLEHAALLQDNKDLTSISQINPTGYAALGLNSNLMVAGSPAGPWASDSTSHLTTYPWLSGGVLPCMWHADKPYSLVHSTFHQGINPAVPYGIPASFTPAYTFARDPQNGQIVVIPAEYISNFAEILEQRSYLWPSMYSSAHSSLQHPSQLQLFSHQQLMQQHELYMLLQQHAVNSIDLHRNIQLEVTESQRNEQADTLELQRNAQHDQESQRSAQMEIKELSRRPRLNVQQYNNTEDHIESSKVGEDSIMEQTSEANLQSCSVSIQKEIIPQTSSTNGSIEFNLSPMALNSFLLSNKTKEMTQQEHVGQQAHSSEHPDLCPTLANVKVQEELKKDKKSQDISSPLEDTSHANSFQNLSPLVQHHYSYKIQPQEAMDAEIFVQFVELPELRTDPSPPLLSSRSHITESTENRIDSSKVEVPAAICTEIIQNERGACSQSAECRKGLAQEKASPDLKQNKDTYLMATEMTDISGMKMNNGKETCSTQTDFSDPLSQDEDCEINMIVMPYEIIDHCVKISKECTDEETDLVASRSFDCSCKDVSSEINSLDLKTEDPLAGMNVLVAATEMPQTSSLLSVNALPFDHMLFQGIILLSEIAELELKKRKPVNHLQNYHVRPSFESLLAASTQMLKEVISFPNLEGLKPESIKLPRELSRMKKYSWKQVKNPHFSATSDIEVMDSVELDCRVRLAALQSQYKEKQRELAKLQNWRDSEENANERSKNLSKKGPGRLKKRKQGISYLLHKEERMKISNRRFEKSVLLSESRSFEGIFRGTLLNVSEVYGMEHVIGEKKGKLHSQKELDSTSHDIYETQSKLMMKLDSGVQDHMANSLDTVLSLPKQIKENTSFKITDHSGRKHRDTRSKNNISDFKQLCSIQLSRTISKEDTDTEEDDKYLRNEWPSHSRPLQYNTCSMLTQRMKFACLPSPERITSCYRMVKHKMSFKRNKPFHLLLLEQETGSFSDSTENSFDQDGQSEEVTDPKNMIFGHGDYSSDEEEEYVIRDSEHLSGPHIEDNGLGLLARFAASVEHSPVLTPPLSNMQLEMQNTEEKKQSLIGTEFEDTDSEGEVKSKTKASADSKFFNSNVANSTVAIISLESKSNVTTSEKGKVIKKARKLKEIQCAKNHSQELGAEVSDDDRWSRRRSERIFLHGLVNCSPMLPDVNTNANSVHKAARYNKVTSSKKGKRQKGKKKRVNKSLSSSICSFDLGRFIPSSLLAGGSSRKSKLEGRRKNVKESHGKCGAVSKLMESMAAEEDFEPSQDSSFSESEHLPMPLHPERPITPAPQSCIIDKDELRDGLRVLIPMDDKLLYAGHVQTVHSPDIYRVVVEGERGNRPHIYCQEQLLQEAIIDVKPPSVRFLMEGTRIAAYWSQQYRCLYPGTVVCGNSDQEEDTDLVTVEFDDGDTGRIPLSHIRLLPPEYKIQCAEPSPALLVQSSKRKVRKTSKEKNIIKEACSVEMAVNKEQRGQKPSIQSLSEEMAVQENKFDDSSQTVKKMEKNIFNPVNSTLKTDIEISQLALHVSTEQSVRNYQKMEINSRTYSGLLSKNLVDGDLYHINQHTIKGKIKTKRRRWQVEEQRNVASFGGGYHKSEARLLVKLDHEGLMSPKTKKTKEAMMRHANSNSAKRDGHFLTECSSMRPKQAGQKHLGSKPHKLHPHFPSEDFDHPCNNLKIISASKNGGKQTESQTSSSESEEDSQSKRNGKNLQGSDTSRQASKSSSSTSSSLSSTSSSSSSTSSSSSSSSPSSSVTAEASSISSVEDTVHVSVSSGTCQKQKPDNKSKTSAHIIQQTQDQLRSGRCKPKKREGMHLPTTKELAKRQRLPSVENRPKIAAFLPAKQLWKWFGKPTQRRGMKGKARKLFYKAIVRGKEIIRTGDCAVFLSAGRPNLPYIGCIQSMWESWGNNMVVKVKWFYHPEETCPGKKFNDKKWKQSDSCSTPSLQFTIQRKDFMERALYRSSHVDENDVQTVSHKCFVVELAQYEQMLKTKKYHDSEDLYYLAGTYEPITGMIYSTDGVPVIC